MSTDLIHGLAALDAAIPAYNEAEQYYNGTVKEIFSSDAIKKVLGKSTNSFVFNYARIVVTSRLSRMEIASVTADNDGLNGILADSWNHNSLDQELQDAFEAALVFGDSYLIAWPDEEDNVGVFYNDPRNTRLFYDVENPRKKKYAIKRWMDGDKLRVNLYYSDTIQKFISKSKPTAAMTDKDFEAYYEDGQETWPLTNESGSIPVFHLRTSRQYGTPEHKAAFGPQNAINKLLTTQVSSIDFTTFPQRYFLEDPTANEGVNPAADFGTTADADDAEEDTVSRLKAGPGGVWNLKGIKQVGQFDTASPDTFVTPFKTYVDSLATTTQTPVHLFQIGSLPSGESLRAAEAPLNKRVESLELLFGGVVRELHEYILSLLGHEAEVSVTWAPVATYDDAEMWATVDAKTAAGVPLTKALLEAGYTQSQIDEWYPEAEGIARSTSELSALADVIQKTGAAVSLGLISKEEARKLLPQDILIETPLADPTATLEAVAALDEPTVAAGDDIKSKAEALGVLIRAGVDPNEAATRVGLQGVQFTGAMPTSLRLPEADAAKLEQA